MEIKPLNKIPRQTVEQLLSAIPFYKTVKKQDEWQFEILLEHSRIVHYIPGEVVLSEGQRDTWLYFLLKGQLAVHVGDSSTRIVNYITPGEVFGDVAMLVESGRTATVAVDANCKNVMVFSTDFRIFGELDNTQPVNLQTKLAYYRNTVHNLRWKLEVYRAKYPQHVLSGCHRQIQLYIGPKDTLEELEGLHAQAQALAKLLLDWNEVFSNSSN